MARNRFTVPMDQMAARTLGRIDETVRGATHALFRKIVDRTPIDSGKARANWNVSVGAPNTTTTESTRKGRATREVNKVLTIPAGEKVHLANGLP
jgi:hypothetical protein